MSSQPKKYKNVENVLLAINKKYIQLSQDKVETNRKILDFVLEKFKDRMKSEDALFNAIFYDVFYGGSFYDELKVGKSNEFDLDLLLDIEKIAEVSCSDPCNKPEFIHLKFKNWKSRCTPEVQKVINKFKMIDNQNYFITERVVSWMQSLLQKVLNGVEDYYCIEGVKFKISLSISGPAATLHVKTYDGKYYYDDQDDDEDPYYDRSEEMSIDLVPCFTFKGWPTNGFIPKPVFS